jgi:hypothetical protein
MRDEPGGVEADEQDGDLNPYHPVQSRRQFGMRRVYPTLCNRSAGGVIEPMELESA